VYVRHPQGSAEPAVEALLQAERDGGYDRLDGYADFAARVAETKWRLLELLIRLRRDGARIVGYGAPGKGNTLLNYCGIRTDLLDYTVDRNPLKHGRFLPGTHIPIHPPERIGETKPDYVLIQFGHNDSHAPYLPESTAAATDYKGYLRRYIDESRAAGAHPLLVTPMVRRTFDADGKLRDDLRSYADAMKEVGAERNVPVIDLHASSKNLVEQLGPEKSAEMANKEGDVTHFNDKGARWPTW